MYISFFCVILKKVKIYLRYGMIDARAMREGRYYTNGHRFTLKSSRVRVNLSLSTDKTILIIFYGSAIKILCRYGGKMCKTRSIKERFSHTHRWGAGRLGRSLLRKSGPSATISARLDDYLYLCECLAFSIPGPLYKDRKKKDRFK